MSDQPPGASPGDDERTHIDGRGGTPPPLPPRPPPLPPLYGQPSAQPPPGTPQPPTQPIPAYSPPEYPYAPPAGPPIAPPGYGSPSGYPGAAQPPPYGGTAPFPQPPPPPGYGGYPPPGQAYGGYGGPPPQQGGYPPAGPPPSMGYAPPPPGGASSGGGKLALGIGGGVLALILVIGGIFLFTRRGGSVDATATPQVGASGITATSTALATQGTRVGGTTTATIAPVATSASTPSASIPSVSPDSTTAASSTFTTVFLRTPTPTGGGANTTGSATSGASSATATSAATRPATTPTGSIRPATSTTVGQGGLPPTPTGSARPAVTTTGGGNVALSQTYTDPKGRFSLKYPAGWTVTQLANSQTNVVEVDGPDNVSFYVDVYKQDGTPADEMQTTIDIRSKSTQFTYTPGPVADAKVGGEPGKLLTYTAKRKDQATAASVDGVLWIVNHGGTEYDFEAVFVGKHRAEIDAIVQSVSFLP